MTDPILFGRGLEPRGRHVLHGAGQSPDAFADFWRATPDTLPALHMTYLGLRHRKMATYFASLTVDLERYRPAMLIPRIGVCVTSDGQPHLRYEHKVAAGQRDAQIDRLVEELANLDRPVFVRLGYEFNGQWNGYDAESFRAAWIRVPSRIRARGHGDEWVDWWGTDPFDVDHFTAPVDAAFRAEALKRRFPVLIGESTPRRIGVQDGKAGWQGYDVPYLAYIAADPQLKAFCSISWNWAGYPQGEDWGDGRITADAEVLARWRTALKNPLFIHAGDRARMDQALNVATPSP